MFKCKFFIIIPQSCLLTFVSMCTKMPWLSCNGLFPPTETDTDSTPCTEGFPDSYIVLCRNFSTSMDLGLDPCTEIFPDGYCTHSLSQGSESESVSVGGNEP